MVLLSLGPACTPITGRVRREGGVATSPIRCACLLAGLVAGLVPGLAAAGEPPALILGATNNMSSIAAFVGVERGLFLKHGLDVKVKVFNPGQEMVKALERGLEVKSVAAWMGRGEVPTHDDAIGIVAGPGRGVGGVADLAGKAVGGTAGWWAPRGAGAPAPGRQR